MHAREKVSKGENEEKPLFSFAPPREEKKKNESNFYHSHSPPHPFGPESFESRSTDNKNHAEKKNALIKGSIISSKKEKQNRTRRKYAQRMYSDQSNVLVRSSRSTISFSSKSWYE